MAKVMIGFPAEQERAAAIAWLRAEAERTMTQVRHQLDRASALNDAANALEAGAHVIYGKDGA